MRKSVVIWSTLGTVVAAVTPAVLLSGGSGEEKKQVGTTTLNQEKESKDDVQIIANIPSSEPEPPKQDQTLEADPVVKTEQKGPKTNDTNPPTPEAPTQKEQVPPNKPTQNLISPPVQSKETPPPAKDNPLPIPKLPQPPAKSPSVNVSTPKPPTPSPGTGNRPRHTASTQKFRTLTGKPPIRVPSSARNYLASHHVPNYALIYLLDTRKIASDQGKEGNPPALKITKAACGDALFPTLTVQLPEQYVKDSQNRTLSVLKDFSLGDSPNPVGCKIIKFSKAKHNAGFSYLSETTVTSGNSGFAMYVASTNAQHKENTVYDVWFLLLNKSGEDWNVTRSYRWHKTSRIMDYDSRTLKQTPFDYKTPDDVWLKWSNEDSGYSKEAMEKLVAGVGSDFDRWHSNDNYYVGVWLGGQQGSDAKQNKHIFHEGSVERWILSFWLGSPQNEPEKLNFLQTVKLTQEGKWTSVKDQCSNLKSKHYFEMNTNELSTCIKSATSSPSP